MYLSGEGGEEDCSAPFVGIISEHVPQHDLPRLYLAADAFVIASRCVPRRALSVRYHFWILSCLRVAYNNSSVYVQVGCASMLSYCTAPLQHQILVLASAAEE